MNKQKVCYESDQKKRNDIIIPDELMNIRRNIPTKSGRRQFDMFVKYYMAFTTLEEVRGQLISYNKNNLNFMEEQNYILRTEVKALKKVYFFLLDRKSLEALNVDLRNFRLSNEEKEYIFQQYNFQLDCYVEHLQRTLIDFNSLVHEKKYSLARDLARKGIYSEIKIISLSDKYEMKSSEIEYYKDTLVHKSIICEKGKTMLRYLKENIKDENFWYLSELKNRLLEHDYTKGYNIEISTLSAINDKGTLEGVKEHDEESKNAIREHVLRNDHHPDFWDGKEIPEIVMYEMVCDWSSRSSQYGTNVIEYFNKYTQTRYNFTNEVYNKFISLLLVVR